MPEPLIRAFTGPSRLNDVQRHFVAYEVENLPPATEVRTGAALGVDTIAAQISARELDGAMHVLYVPAAPHNEDLTSGRVKFFNEFVWCPNPNPNAEPSLFSDGPTRDDVRAAYRLRNEWMVRGRETQHPAEEFFPGPTGRPPTWIVLEAIPADELIAFVRRDQFYRSGEWMTINIARRASVTVRTIVLPA